MADDHEDIPALDELMSLPAEPRPFAPEQMVTCDACLRANPPTRVSCLYCGATLPLTEAAAALRKPTLRRLETWEQGFNNILLPDEATNLAEESLAEAAALLRLTIEELQRILDARMPLPLARAATLDEASLIKNRLAELGLNVLIVSDQDLNEEAFTPKRIRALEFEDEALIAHPTGGGEGLSIEWAEILLFVAGRHYVRRLELKERRRRGADDEIVNARELSTDESMLDIYTARRDGGWRIVASNFDFSCLAEKKGLLAPENFSTLTRELCVRSREATYDECYSRVRHALTIVWPLEQNTEAGGWRRDRPGKYSTEAVTTSNNESQFTRYSRLRHFLKLHFADSKTV